MEVELLKALSIIFLTMLKFIAGPTLGYAAGFSLLNTILITVVGMMLSVLLFTFLGDFLRKRVFRKFFERKKKFSKRNRRFVTIWKKYGVVGVAVLTPLLLTPIGGTILLTSVGTPNQKIILYMFVSAVCSAVVFSSLIYLLGTEFLPI